MKKARTIFSITGVFILLFSNGIIDNSGGLSAQTVTKSVQTKTKSVQTDSKSVQIKTKSAKTKPKSAQAKSKTTPAKSKPVQKSANPEPEVGIKYPGTVTIGTQIWAEANLNVSIFSNGDTIPEAKTSKEWVAAGEAGKPAWCYYNNEPKIGLIYGKLYNWYAVNDPRGLAPAGWILPSDVDWAKLINYLGGSGAAGIKMKNNTRWSDGNNGTNETGFKGFPAGYRAENGSFLNIASIGIWWSSTENNPLSAIDHYLSQSSSISRSSSPKQRGESVRCIRNQ